MSQQIHVINPNSNPAVTAGIDEALRCMAFANGPQIVCSTLAQGPFGIESQADSDGVIGPLSDTIRDDHNSDAFIIACYSDPGLHACREATDKPVFGIAECGVLTALVRADQFGVIAIANASIQRHRRYLRQMGLSERLAGERPLDMTVAQTASDDNTLARMTEVGQQLRDIDGAGAIVLGCAGMARHRAALEQALGVPVIDPTQAAVIMAIGALATAG